MKIFAETERLILRELLTTDVEAFFEMDSNAEVHKYLGNNPIQTLDQAFEQIANVQQQYIDNKIGRWAVIEKSSGEFIGWCGLKLVKENWNNHINFYDIGYRLNPKYWQKGYATESAMAALAYGFNNLKISEIIGTANVENKASRNTLEKCGLKFIEKFYWNTIYCDWLRITNEEWNEIKFKNKIQKL
jgi:[ribosomal protein S5]-alanine N-acetyltransferase